MKKIVSLIQIVLLCGGFLLTTSCEDFLTKEPLATLAGSTLENESGVEGILAGAYAQLRGGEIFGSAMGTDWVYGSAASDDAYKGSEEGDQTQFNQVERYNALPDNPYMNERWRDCFNGVSRCNQVLVFMKTVQAGSNPIGAERAKEIEAETKYLRAWYHFSANRVFKNIPYIRTPDEQDGKEADEIPNKDAGWAEMEADLTFAVSNLPESFPGQPGRANKYAAMTLLAQAYMYQNKLSQAKPLLDQIIGSGKYSLAANYNDNYDERTENNSESIFEIQCSQTATHRTGMRLAGACMVQPTGPAGIGWGFYQVSQCLVDAYQVTADGLPVLDINQRATVKNDMGIASDEEFTMTDQLLDSRLDWTVARRGVDFNGWGIFPGMAWIRAQGNGGPYMTKKYMHFQASQSRQAGSGFENDRNFRFHRLAHVILWRAEIAVEDGDLEMARDLVNQIRNRVKTSDPVMGFCTATTISSMGISGDSPFVDWDKPAANYKTEPYPAGHAAFSSQANAREAVRLEIRLEFATEGQRFFDLRRWGIDEAVLNDFIQRDGQFRPFMRGSTYSVKRRYWPVPQSQIDIQPGVLTQDPDYL